MITSLIYLVIPTTSAFIGWLTNALAIQMMFHPIARELEPRRYTATQGSVRRVTGTSSSHAYERNRAVYIHILHYSRRVLETVSRSSVLLMWGDITLFDACARPTSR